MNKNLLFAALAFIAASCTNESGSGIDQARTPVTVQVKGFEVSQEDIPQTRGTAVINYTSVKSLTLAFYKSDGTETYKHTQLRADGTTYTTFGEFACSLPMGNYTMVVIGYCGTSPFTLTSPTLATCTDTRLQDNFVVTQPVVINSNTAVNLTATLDRVVSRLGIRSTDNRVAEAEKIRMTFTAGGRDFNPTTGLANTNTGFANTYTFSESSGVTVSAASFLFLASDEQTMNVTIETLDSEDNVLFTKVVNNVPFKRNRTTILSGNLFTAETNVSSITINSDWIDSYESDL